MTCLLYLSSQWSGQIKIVPAILPRHYTPALHTHQSASTSITLAYIWDLRHFVIFSSRTHLSNCWWIIKCLFGEKTQSVPPSIPAILHNLHPYLNLTVLTFTMLALDGEKSMLGHINKMCFMILSMSIVHVCELVRCVIFHLEKCQNVKGQLIGDMKLNYSGSSFKSWKLTAGLRGTQRHGWTF